MKKYYVYIMNSPTGTLYIGITSNLKRRVYEHKQKLRDFSPCGVEMTWGEVPG